MNKHRHQRRVWQYKGCKVSPCHEQHGRYFGNPNWPQNPTQYRKAFWRCNFACGGWRYFGTKDEVRDFLDNPRNQRFSEPTLF